MQIKEGNEKGLGDIGVARQEKKDIIARSQY